MKDEYRRIRFWINRSEEIYHLHKDLAIKELQIAKDRIDKAIEELEEL